MTMKNSNDTSWDRTSDLPNKRKIRGPRTETCGTLCLNLAQFETLLLFSLSLYMSVLQCLLSSLILLETLIPSLKKKIISLY